MIRNISLTEDIEIERFARISPEDKPNFDWAGSLNGDRIRRPEITIEMPSGERAFDLGDVAEMIGTALTDLLLSRSESEEGIFSEQNRRFVTKIAQVVGEKLVSRLREGMELHLSDHDLYLLVEKALIESDAHDVARALVIARGSENSRDDDLDSLATPNVRLIRRNRQVVPWNQSKIEIAIRKAFLSLHLDSEPAVEVARSVTQRVAGMGTSFVDIEQVQDIVQEQLMRLGHFKVAEAYILYRAHRKTLREQEGQVPAETAGQDSMIVVKADDGSSYFWDGLDLRRRIDFAMIGLELDLSAEIIEQELRRSLYPEMTVADLKKTIILNAKALIERDADFAKFAGRILVTYIYEEVLDWRIDQTGIEGLREAHARALKKNLKRGVEIERINPKLLAFDLDKLGEALDPTADLDFDYLGIQTLYDRYLIIDKQTKPVRRLETPQLFWMRVAMGLFAEEGGQPEDRMIELYNLYKSRRFCSSTPTLFNSGTLHSQLSSCYLYKVDDSIESIMNRGIAENAFLSKWAGGLGGSWTSVRGTGGYIKGTNGESQGVIPFLKLHNDQLVAVNQGGKRRGSGCAYLETWHNDVFDFLELRKNVGDDRRRTHDMNTANWIPDLFMKRMEARGTWTLFRANEVPDLHDLFGKAFELKYEEYEEKARRGEIWGKEIPALDLWKSMLRMLFETGHPWITFKDTCNIRSPQDHAGVIHSSNLCTEITLNTSADETAVCNLGSVVLDSHLDKDGQLDLEKLRETVRVAVRALDNVIDINFYPTEAARNANLRHRPIGLGVMGLQNALYRRGLAFSDPGAVEFNDEFMEAIAFYAYEASSDLAAEKGKYSSYSGSKWDRGLLPQDTLDLLEKERGEALDVPRGGKLDWTPVREKIARQGMRNSNVIAIAPTATISNIMGTSPCIEPTYKNLFVKSNLSGDFIVLNQFLVKDLKKAGLWNKEMLDQLKYFDGELDDVQGIPDAIRERYKTAFAVGYEAVVDASARRQKWIDQAQSVNLWINTNDMKPISHMYRRAWHKGLKTTYYLRTLGASHIEKATAAQKKEVRGVMGGATEASGGAASLSQPADVGEAGLNAAPAHLAGEEAAPSAGACRWDPDKSAEDCEACQ